MKLNLLYCVGGLRKYFRLSCFSKEVKKAELLGTNESLKAFGKLWNDHKEDVMMMASVLKEEFITENSFTDEGASTYKKAMADMIQFMQGCANEWNEFEREQAKKQAE